MVCVVVLSFMDEGSSVMSSKLCISGTVPTREPSASRAKAFAGECEICVCVRVYVCVHVCVCMRVCVVCVHVFVCVHDLTCI